MRFICRNILLSALIYFASCILQPAFSQVFPVQATTQLTPPYSLYLTDYVAPGSERLALNIFLGDIARPDLQVKLKLRIVGQNITIETKPEYNPPSISIQGGVPLRLISSDLADYFNPDNLNFTGSITRRQFDQQGKLPEGVYQICFEVLEYNRSIKISNTACGNAWMILNDPPLINLPRRDEKLKPQNPQNVVLQWTPRHTGSPNSAFSTEYEVKLVEVWPATRNINDAILTSPPIFEETTQSTTLIYGPSETPLELGRKYAFRVRAKSMVGVDELDLFKNQGYSETYSFIYGDACVLPTGVIAEAGSFRLNLRWDGQFNHTAFKVQYRQAGTAQWYTNTSTFNETEITSLKPSTVYEYQIAGTCGFFEGAYTTVASVKTKDAPSIDYACGKPLETFNLDPSQLTGSLKIGDIIKTGDFDVQVATINGSGGTFSGEGVVVMPMMNKVKVKTEFTNITVANEGDNYRMVNGFMNVTGAGVEVVPQGVKDFMDKLEEIADIADSVLTIAEGFIPAPGPDPETFVADELIHIDGNVLAVVKDQATGKVTITTTSGKVVELPPGGSYAVTDNTGKGYLVDSKGNHTKTTAAVAVKASKREYNLAMQFIEDGTSTKYGLDKKKIDALANNYEIINENYFVSWKAVDTKSTDAVVAKLDDSSVDVSKVRFTKEGQTFAAPPPVNREWRFSTLRGSNEGSVESIVAFYTPSDTSQKEQVLGKLNMVGYEKIKKNLVVVPVNGITYPYAVAKLKTDLNKIYGQAVAEWDVTLDNSNLQVALSAQFDDGESGMLANYTEDMRKVINAFRDKMVAGTYYLFMVKNPKSRETLGFMPRSKEAGFIFVDKHDSEEKITYTIAHELGHGAFTLEHIFSDYPALKGITPPTQNLMDHNNSTGSELLKYQWDKIHDPVVVINLFEDDAAGRSESIPGCDVTVNNLLYNHPEGYFSGAPYSEGALLKYISDNKLWKPGEIISSIDIIAEKIKEEFYFIYDERIGTYFFDVKKWVSDHKAKTITEELYKARARFYILFIQYDYLFFGGLKSKNCGYYRKGSTEGETAYFLNTIANGLLKPKNINSKGKFVWNGKESNLPDPTKYFAKENGRYDFESLKMHLQYIILFRNENNQLNGSLEGNLFLEKRYQELLFKCGNVMLTVGMDNIKGLTNETTRQGIKSTFRQICNDVHNSDVYFRWKTIVDEREKQEYERKLRELALKELAAQIAEANASAARLDIYIGTVGLAFLVIFPPTTEFGIPLLLAEIAQGVYSADQVWGGVHTLRAIQDNVFDSKKEYKLIRGFLVDENGPNGAVIMYDIGNIFTGFASAGVGVKEIINIRDAKSIFIMGDDLKRALMSSDVSVGLYDTAGDSYTFYKK